MANNKLLLFKLLFLPLAVLLSAGCQEKPYDCIGRGQIYDKESKIGCCSGLKSKFMSIPITGAGSGENACQPETEYTICLDCGNGVCNSPENWCTCPEDCRKS